MQTLCPPFVRRWALGVFLVLCGLANLQAATSVSSTQSGRWTLAGSPYLVTDDVFVPAGQTLEIDPGVIVQFQGVEDALVVDGVLVARGTSGNPIVFTSAAAVKAPGQWESIYFRAANTNSVMQNCVVEYGASQGFSDHIIWVANGSPAFLNCVIRGSRVDGLLLLASDARVEGCQFTGNGNNALAVRADSLPTLRNNTASGNKVNAIAVFGGSFTRTGTWTRDEIPYVVTEDLFVGSGQTLTLEPGTTVQFQGPEDALVVDGVLVARGTAASPIVFTSAAVTKEPGQWEGLYFRAVNTNSVLERCVVEYAGSRGFADQNIWVANGAPSFVNCTIRGSRVDGLLLLASDARVEGCQFTGNGNFAIAMRADSLPALRRNSASGNAGNAIGVFGFSFTRTGTWTRDEIPYTVVEDLFVSSGQTLTLEPGTIVQFQGVEDALVVDGTLVANGTAEAPIRFTSDDAVKAPGQWEGIVFRGAANTNSVMTHCVVEYGGSSGFSDENIRLENASPVIRDSVIQHSRVHGLRVVNADPRLENCGFTNNGATNGGFAVALRADSLPRLARNHGSGNGNDAIGVYGFSFTRTGTWSRDDLPYTVIEDLFISSGQTLTLEPGVIMQFQGPEDSLVVDGTLIANGTTDAPIRFTSDDAVKAPGQWEGILFRNGSANSFMSNCIVEFGAAQGFVDECIRVEGVSPSVVNTTIRDSRLHGMTIVNADPRVENCVFLRNGATNGGFAITMRADSLPRLRGNSGSGNGNNAIGVYGFSATRTGTWMRDGLPYTIVEDLFVSSGQTLTLEPGLIMQFQGPEDGLFVDGTLIARGSAGAPIRFTSDNAVKTPGQWEAIYFRAANANSVLENCVVEFAGGDGEGNIVAQNSSPRITNTIVQNGARDGIHLNGAAPQISASRLSGNGRDGLRVFNGANPVINNSTIAGNGALAVNNFDTSVVVNARNNFWGDPSGPLDNLNTDGRNQLNPNGKGGKVGEYVDWSGFGATDPAPVDQPVVPHLAVTPLTLDFGPVTAGQLKVLPLTLQSTGSGPVTVKSVTNGDVRFQVADLVTPFALATNTSRVIQVQFRPDGAGAFAGTLIIASDDPDASAISVSLKGSGIGSPVSTNCIAAPSGLVAWWSGDRDASDLAGTNHAALKDGVTFSPGKVSGAFVFDGVSQSVDTPLDVQPSAMPSMTWEAWVYPTRLNYGIRQQILCNDDGGYDRGLLIESGTSNFGVFTGGGAWQPAPATPDQWQHVAVVFTSGNIEFYKNGVRFSLGSAPAGQNSGLKLSIGRNPGFGEYFKGMIDEVSVYNRALSAAEIQAIFNAGEAGKCKGSNPTGAPFLHVAQTSLDFGEVQVGQGKDVPLSVDNSGTATLIINSIAVDGTAFKVISPATPVTLAAGAATNLTVRFLPKAPGTQSGKLVFSSNEAAGRGPVEVVLRGLGVAAGAPPVISNLEPASGGAGTAVAIKGTNFAQNPSLVAVEIGGLRATVLATAPNSILAVVPAGLPFGTTNVIVKVNGVASNPAAFAVGPAVTPDAKLAARPEGANVVISWPAVAAGYQLESAPSLAFPILWTPVETAPVLGEGILTVTQAPAEGIRFYRLRGGRPQANNGGALIQAVPGGVVSVAGGEMSLTVPPGALDADTSIQITRLVQPSQENLPFATQVILSPAGLIFKEPATLTLKLPPGIDGRALEVYYLSELNQARRAGAETNYLDLLSNYTYDPGTGTLRVPVSHFSVLTMFTRRFHTEFVFDVPGKYLKKGDLIYSLTRDPTFGPGHNNLGWFPGHTGLYLGTTDPASDKNDGQTIIESTSLDETPDKSFGGYLDGVQTRTDFDSPSSFFKYMGRGNNHLYMGARRPRPEPTDAERNAIAAWALSKTNPRVPYSYVGGTGFSSGSSGLSCVALTEGAYEAAGRNIVPGYREFPLLPVDQFSYTEPVTEVTIEAGDNFFMQVYAVIAPSILGEYRTAPAPDYDMVMTQTENTPADEVVRNGKAKFFSSQFFNFKPTAEDADLGYVFRFTLKNVKSGENVRTVAFFIHVKEKEISNVFVRQDPPVIQVEPAFSAGDLVVTNNSAYVSSNAKLYLRWPEPPQQVITGQKFDMTITPDPTTAAVVAGQSSTSPSSQRRLYGDVNILPQLFADSFALIGYFENGNKKCGFDRCFDLTQVPITRSVTTGADEFTVKVNVAAYGGLTFGGNGERRGSVTWTYKRK